MDHLNYINSLTARRMVEVLDRTFRMYREHFILFVMIVACVTVPLTILVQVTQTEKVTFNYWYGAEETQTETPASVIILGVFLQLVVVCLIAYSTSELALGYRPSIKEGLTRIIRRFFTLMLAMLLIGGIAALLFIGVSILLVALGDSLCGLLPLFLIIVISYFVWCASLYIIPMIIVEQVGFLLGVRRGMTLVKRRFWRNFWFVFNLVMIVLVLVLAFSQFTSLILGEANNNGTITLVVNLIIQIFIIPIAPIGLTLMYYDTRVHTEGLDLALITADNPTPRPIHIASPVPRDASITSQDVKNIVMLSLSFGGIIFGFYVLAVVFFESVYY